MPKREDIKKVMVIGSGPIVIGQAAEFDYAGTQACLALKEEGYEVILVNSNPATIMTDTHLADKVYMEPLTIDYVAKIIRKERPDAIVPGLGGQTGLNLVVQLANKGVLDECRVEILGTRLEAIEEAEDREKFRALCEKINQPVLRSYIAHTVEQAKAQANEIGYPVVVRPAFTLGGTGGGFVDNDEELEEIAATGIQVSPANQVLIEKSVFGYKEIEYEVMRDKSGKAIAICDMENIDPVGVHTGDSAVVAPILTLDNETREMLKGAALDIITALKIEGGCNVQFALNPNSKEYYVIEVNPRVSRSSALASKATGYPIARVTGKIAVGYTLDEIEVANRPGSIEPSCDYKVIKLPRFPFDKFDQASRLLGTQMKATGEIMSIGKTMEEALLKGVRSLEIKADHFALPKIEALSDDELLERLAKPDDERLFEICALLRRGYSEQMLADITKVAKEFITILNNIVRYETTIKENVGNIEVLKEAKKMGFSDKYIGQVWEMKQEKVFLLRKENNIFPVFQMADACITKEDTYLPYFYSTYNMEKQESILTDNKKIIVLGSGPIRIGQGVEFDYSTVHAIWAIKEEGYEAIVINCNPETVSTDYTTSDKLYFEPLTIEDVMNVIEYEKPEGVIVQLGGQTAINLAESLHELNVKIIGTDVAAIERAENRDAFEHLLNELNIPRPNGTAVTKIEDGVVVANRIGYPVLVRPSYVLGGRAMQIVTNDEELNKYLTSAVEVDEAQPVLIDKYVLGQEVEIDAICDGKDVYIPGIMEHIEKTGVHSGDSISVYPSYSISDHAKGLIEEYTVKLGLAVGIIGLFNIQFIVDKNDDVYIIEVNPRSSRTVPFLSKTTKVQMANIATKVILGKKLADFGLGTGVKERPNRYYVKAPTFSFAKIRGVDAILGPEMKSTGEAIGYDKAFENALYKALQASGMHISNYGTVLFTIADQDKKDALEIAQRFYDLGFNLIGTKGTALYLKEHGLRCKAIEKIHEDSEEILNWVRSGHVKYVINTMTNNDHKVRKDGFRIRREAVEHNIPTLTSLDTVKILLDVLESITIKVGVIND